jgi:sugar phosphate permease
MLSVLVGTLAVFYGVIWPMYGACAGDYFPKEVMGTVIGAWTPFYGLGAILVLYCKEEHNEHKVFGRVSKRIKSTG